MVSLRSAMFKRQPRVAHLRVKCDTESPKRSKNSRSGDLVRKSRPRSSRSGDLASFARSLHRVLSTRHLDIKRDLKTNKKFRPPSQVATKSRKLFVNCLENKPHSANPLHPEPPRPRSKTAGYFLTSTGNQVGLLEPLLEAEDEGDLKSTRKVPERGSTYKKLKIIRELSKTPKDPQSAFSPQNLNIIRTLSKQASKSRQQASKNPVNFDSPKVRKTKSVGDIAKLMAAVRTEGRDRAESIRKKAASFQVKHQADFWSFVGKRVDTPELTPKNRKTLKKVVREEPANALEEDTLIAVSGLSLLLPARFRDNKLCFSVQRRYGDWFDRHVV